VKCCKQPNFQFFENLMIVFYLRKVIKKLFPFHIYFSYLCKISNQEKDLSWHVYLNVFSITLSHILKELHEFLCMMGALNHFFFWVKIVLYLVLWVMDWCKSLGAGWVHIWRGWERNKVSKEKCESFYNQIRMESSHLVSKGHDPLKLLFSIMILNTTSLPYKALKWDTQKD